jgi:hypothetical protein
MLALLGCLACVARAVGLFLGRDLLGWDRRRRLLGDGVVKPQGGSLLEGGIAGHLSAPELEQRDDGLVERRLGRQVDLNGACGHARIPLSPLPPHSRREPTNCRGHYRDVALAGGARGPRIRAPQPPLGIVGPLAAAGVRASWGWLGLAGLIGGGPTFLGTIVGTSFSSTYLFVGCLALAGGALLYVIGEILPVGRRLSWEVTLWGLMAGFLLALATELVLEVVGG